MANGVHSDEMSRSAASYPGLHYIFASSLSVVALGNRAPRPLTTLVPSLSTIAALYYVCRLFDEWQMGRPR